MEVVYVDQYEELFGVQPVCDVLAERDAPIVPSIYCAVRIRPPSARSRRDEYLTEEIGRIHADDYGVYGVRKVLAALVREEITVGPLHGRTAHAPGRSARGDPGQEPVNAPPRSRDRPAR
jgi:hypothetical protein